MIRDKRLLKATGHLRTVSVGHGNVDQYQVALEPTCSAQSLDRLILRLHVRATIPLKVNAGNRDLVVYAK